MPAIVAITSDGLKHDYFLRRLAESVPLKSVFIEPHSYPAPTPSSTEEKQAWQWYFERREAYETRLLTTVGPRPSCPVIGLQTGGINSDATFEQISKQQPDLIVIFGTSLLGPHWLSAFPGRIFNLHLGLPMHYRGSSCAFWPIHDKHLSVMGAAIHTLDSGIDTGTILEYGSIELDIADDEQTLAGKTFTLGTGLLVSAIRRWQRGNLIPTVMKKPGRLYRMKDFTPKAVLRVKRMVESGELRQLIEKEVNPG